MLGRGAGPARPTEPGLLTGVMDRDQLQAPRDGCGWDALFSRRPARPCLVRHQSLIVGSDGGSSHDGPVFGSVVFKPDAGPIAACSISNVSPAPWATSILAFLHIVSVGAWSVGTDCWDGRWADSETSMVTRVLANGCDSGGSHQIGVLPKAFVPAYCAVRGEVCPRALGNMDTRSVAAAVVKLSMPCPQSKWGVGHSSLGGSSRTTGADSNPTSGNSKSGWEATTANSQLEGSRPSMLDIRRCVVQCS